MGWQVIRFATCALWIEFTKYGRSSKMRTVFLPRGVSRTRVRPGEVYIVQENTPRERMMTRGSISKFFVVAISASMLSVGCATSPETTETEGTATPPTEEVVVIEEEAIEVVEVVPEPIVELGTVYFDYDRAVIREDMKVALRESADQILANSGWGAVIIEGHCDERGSEEYNFALGERRAATVKKYLVALGVPADRLETVSFGETQPAVRGHDESAWRYNRRAEFRSASR